MSKKINTPGLLNEPVITVYPSLAVKIGVNAACILQQLHFLVNTTQTAKNTHNYINGQWWVYNSYRQWRDNYFPWLSERTIQNTFLDLEKKGVVKSMQGVKSKSDRRKWYTIDYGAWHTFYGNEDDHGTKNVSSDGTKNVSSVSETTTETTKDSPSPKNGEGKTVTGKPKTTVVHFQDVKAHWDKETQTWDNDRFVWIGRQDNTHRMPLSKWHNPYLPRDNRESAECRKLYGEFIKLDRKTIDLYNQVRDELSGKTLVDNCIPIEDSHGHELAAIADKKGFRPRTQWYEAIRIVFKHHGPSNRNVEKMLQGTATKGVWAECNLDPPLQDVQEIYAFEDWYHKTYPDRGIMVAKANTILSEINNWRAWRLKRLEAPKPAPLPTQPQPLNNPVAAMSFPGVSIGFEDDTPVLTPEEEQEVAEFRAKGLKEWREKHAQRERENPHAPAPGTVKKSENKRDQR